MLNYEARENRFEKCAHVNSRLIFGNPDAIPNPWITIVIPTYKRANLLKNALDSVVTQHHVSFFWDILIVDNEPDDGKENETERLIRSYQNERILYYRNSENIWVGDNFNRCILLARGKWVMMLHDDDMLISNALKVMGNYLRAYDSEETPVGAIAASYIQVEYDPVRDEILSDVAERNNYWSLQPQNYLLYQLTHNNVKFLSHVGGAAPTNGSTFRREAVLKMGGFNETWGISGDLILFYNLESEYYVYQSLTPLGFYRWGVNSMMQKDSIYRVIKDNFDFREYVYQKSMLVGKLFRACHYRKFSSEAIQERMNVSQEQLSLSDFDDIYAKRPPPLWYLFYKCVIIRAYTFHKMLQSRRNERKAKKRMRERNM